MMERVTHDGKLLALIVRRDYENQGVTFFTPDDFPQQLAYMRHPRGKMIQPHVHNPARRTVLYTQEVLVIKKGKLRVDFYTGDRRYRCSRELETGDVILLASGGHGFEMLEETEMYEIKQGPYAGENDKTRFAPPAREGQ